MKTKFNGILTLILALTVQFVFAQKTVTGSVTDENGPLPGVNIIIKGTKTGTETDFDGKYSITAKQGDILVFSYVGLKTVERKVEGSVMDVVMEVSDENLIDEVVVTAYGKKKSKNEFTGNAKNINADEITKTSFVSTEQALQGKAAGVLVNGTSGTPGSNQQIRIRGIQTVNAGSAPLYVIDGVAVSKENLSGSTAVSSLSPIANLRSDDIESITILKDAISTAPYGTEGSNGVIMITTKSGKKGQTKFNFSSTVGYNNNSSEGLTPLTGEQKLELVKEGVWNTYGTNSTGGLGFIATRDEVVDFMSGFSTFANATNWIDAGKPSYDWGNEIKVKNAPLISSDFSVSSGNDKSSFYGSLGYNKTASTVVGSDFSRIGALMKFDTNLSDKVSFKISLNGANFIQNASLEQAAYFSNPNLTRFFMSPWVNPYEEDGTPNITSILDQTSIHNTLYTTTKNIRKNDVVKILENSELKYKFTDNLFFKSKFDVEYSDTFYKNYNNPNHGDGRATNGYVEESAYKVFGYNTQNSMDYSFKLRENHSIGLTALQEFTKYKTKYMYGYGENLPNDYLTNLSATSDAKDSYSSFDDRMTTRYVGLLAYNYAGKYLLDGSYSYQGDSRFYAPSRWDDFYSIGFGWNIHKENFLKENKIFSNLRLKGSFGKTGNADIGINVYQYAFTFNDYNGGPATYVSTYGTTAEWEKGLKRDIALEYGLWENRIKGSVAYFSNLSYDMLFNAQLPMSSQFVPGAATRNIGEMTNKGLELELSVDVLKNDNFNWNINGNYGSLDNMVTKLPETVNLTTGTRQVSQDHLLWEWYMPVWKGVNADTGLPEWYVDVNDATNPDAVTNIYAEAKKAYQGTSATPKYSGALNTRFDYKNLFVEGGVYIAGGHQVYEDWAAYTQTSNAGRLNSFNGSTVLYDGVWRQPGDNATHPRMEYSNSMVANANLASTRFLYDGDYIRLRDVAIGYSFDKSFFQNLFFDSVSLTLRGTNLLTWVKDDRLKWDPEVRQDGFTNLTTPPVKTVVFNINVKF